MDRSFLANDEVIEASRKFVCVRLATWENAAETKFTHSLYSTRRTPEVNTVFTIFSPDLKKKLLSPTRSPSMTFGADDPAQMVAAMKKIAAKYKAKRSQISKTQPIPYGIDLRRSLNVAACDMQLLVVVVAKTEAKRKAIEKALAPIAWSKELVGVFAYTTAKPAELKALDGARILEGVLVVQAGEYGLRGKVIASATSLSESTITAALKKGLAAFKPEKKDSLRHIGYARRNGIKWETEVKTTATRPRR